MIVKRSLLRKWSYVLGITLLMSIALVGVTLWVFRLDLTRDVASEIRSHADQLHFTSVVIDMDGLPLGTFDQQSRFPIPLKQIPDRVKQAFLAAEDHDFYRHHGVSVLALTRALWLNIRQQKYAEGGSTITQQLVRQFLLQKEKTIARKVRELILSLKLERQMSKNEILEIWLNSVFLGRNSWGVEAASRQFFGKSTSAISWSEASLLAGLPQAPSRFAPKLRPLAAKKRQQYVLNQLKTLKWISQHDYEKAYNQRLPVEGERSTDLPPLQASQWIIDATRLELQRRLEQFHLPMAGLKVQTTIKKNWQASLQTLADQNVLQIRAAGLEFASMVLDSKTGEIRAFIGGSDVSQSKFNRAFYLRRPFGTAVYPLVFDLAVQKGMVSLNGFSSLAEAAIKSRYAEAEHVASELGAGLVQDYFFKIGLALKEGAAVDELFGSPLELARAFLTLTDGDQSPAKGLVSSVKDQSNLIYSAAVQLSGGAEASEEDTNRVKNNWPSGRSAKKWMARDWLAINGRMTRSVLADQPYLKVEKGWNCWWVVARTDVVISAWIGAEAREPKNPTAIKDRELIVEQLLSQWIHQNLNHQNAIGPVPDGISYQLYSVGLGKPAIIMPFVVLDQVVF